MSLLDPKTPLFVALIHYPIIDRHKMIITASVTNLDLHDIARSCRTYDVKRYFIVHPSQDEQALNSRIMNHWKTGAGKRSHPSRESAFDLVELALDFDPVLKRIEEMTGQKPIVVGTHAREDSPVVSVSELGHRTEGRPLLLVFGTGYGLAPVWWEKLDLFLAPIKGPQEYNHLSVRSAVAIYLDRLRGS